MPFYTPEPDVVHEIVGHARMLASPAFADLYQAAGAASILPRPTRRTTSSAALFWFTVEFGLVRESGELKAYGAGLLSSFGEIEVFRRAEVRPFDVREMGATAYDVTRYQPVLYVAESLPRLLDDLGGFFESYDDDTYGRIAAAAAGGGRRRPLPAESSAVPATESPMWAGRAGRCRAARPGTPPIPPALAGGCSGSPGTGCRGRSAT